MLYLRLAGKRWGEGPSFSWLLPCRGLRGPFLSSANTTGVPAPGRGRLSASSFEHRQPSHFEFYFYTLFSVCATAHMEKAEGVRWGQTPPADCQAWLQATSPPEPSVWPWPRARGLLVCLLCRVNALGLLGGVWWRCCERRRKQSERASWRKRQPLDCEECFRG